MTDGHYDVVVIGTGPGGEGAAMQAAKAGKRVAVVERYVEVGGGCTHWGTIPSKALRHAITRLNECTANPLLVGEHKRLASYPDLIRAAAGSVIDRQVVLRESFYDRNRVPIIQGSARFVDPHTVEVPGGVKAPHRLAASHFVIATGSRPYRPPDVDFTHPRVFDADTILRMDTTPQTMTIYGAGVVGSEYASMFCGMGMKVNLVNTRGKLLEFLDDEIIDALAYHLRETGGAVLLHNEEYERVEGVDDGVVLHLKSGKKLKTDVLLWTNGRTGNTQDLGLEAIGLTVNSRGQLAVNADFQTALPHVYAVGDVIGPPALASAAYDQGRYAARHVIHGNVDHKLVEDIPTGIYTTPEISSLGKTERDLTEQKVPYEVGRAFFNSLARAQITGQTAGMLKILFHRQTLALLGIHCFGDQASEIIHIGQAIMSQKGGANTLMYFVNTTFNYPTMAEAYRVAALSGLNRLF